MMMNVFNIPKQADHELIYSKHAIERANEREVPMPKYIPFGAKFVEKRYIKEKLRYKLCYTYNDAEYFIVLAEDKSVMTVYPCKDPTSVAIAKLRTRMNANFVASDQFICLDYETDVYMNQSYA
jgi:hypothetical protein